MERDELRGTQAIIHVDSLINNIKFVKERSGDAIVCAVVKADAYGHGAVEAAKIFLDNGADRLAVSALDEAIELRNNGIEADILVLGYTPLSSSEALVRHNITGTIYTKDMALAIDKAAEKLGKRAKVHIKIDSGMGRIGYLVNEESVNEILEISRLKNIEIEGMFTHMARADEFDKSVALSQFEKFKWMIEQLESLGVKISIKHAANSASILQFMPDFKFDMVRAGIILYGCAPSKEVGFKEGEILPTMTLRTEISNVKIVPEGTGISYGHKYIADKEKKIATIPVGYADGYTRMLSNKTFVGINGKRVRQVGNICMDQCMLELEEDAHIGEEVIIFGKGHGDEPTVDDLADILGTINYEILCMVSRRIPRVYEKGGKIIKTVNYLI